MVHRRGHCGREAGNLTRMFSPDLLKDQVVIITGGGTGIGLATAKRLGELGAKVAIGSRNSANLEHGSAELRHAGLDPLVVQVDVRLPDQVDEMAARVVKHFGRIDVLVNNAAGNFICRAEELSPNGWNAVINIVLNGSFYCTRAVGRHLIARRAPGSIVSILANYVWTGSAGTVHSAAAKAGVMSMTQTLAVEWAKYGIRVNALAPGPVESPGAAKQLWNSPRGRRAHHQHGAARQMGKARGNCERRGLSDFAPGWIHYRRDTDDRRWRLARQGTVRVRVTSPRVIPPGLKAGLRTQRA